MILAKSHSRWPFFGQLAMIARLSCPDVLFGPGSQVRGRSMHLCVEGCQAELAPGIRQALNQGRLWAPIG
jgi:hypothetical protein